MTERDRHTWQCRLQLAKALLQKPEVHVDDVDVALPPEFRNLLGATFARFVQKGWMRETGERRRSRHPASNGRRSGVYTITQLGRERLGDAGASPSRVSGPLLSPPPTAGSSACPGPAVGTSSPAHGVSATPRLAFTADPRARAAREDALMARCQQEVDRGTCTWGESQQLELAA